MKSFFFPANFLSNQGNEKEPQRRARNISVLKPQSKFIKHSKITNMKKNPKREQLLEGKTHIEKYTEIERENRILLEKIHRIMKKKPHHVAKNRKSSLNFSQRVQRQSRILVENAEIFKKLQNKKSEYEFEFDASVHRNNSEFSQKYISTIPPDSSLLNYPTMEKPRKLSPLIVDIKRFRHKNRVILNGQCFEVDITQGIDSIRMVASEENTENSYSLELLYQDALFYMDGREDWEKLIRCLDLAGSELTLVKESLY